MFGRSVLGTIGTSYSILASSDGRHKVGGVTIDWSTVAPVAGSDVTLGDGKVVKVGTSYLRSGQVVCQITASGKYGPYDPTALDGRQNLTRGLCWIVERTVTNDDPHGDYPPVIDGGTVWLARLLQSGTGAHSLAAGPTKAELEAAFPGLQYAVV